MSILKSKRRAKKRSANYELPEQKKSALIGKHSVLKPIDQLKGARELERFSIPIPRYWVIREKQLVPKKVQGAGHTAKIRESKVAFIPVKDIPLKNRPKHVGQVMNWVDRMAGHEVMMKTETGREQMGVRTIDTGEWGNFGLDKNKRLCVRDTGLITRYTRNQLYRNKESVLVEAAQQLLHNTSTKIEKKVRKQLLKWAREKGYNWERKLQNIR